MFFILCLLSGLFSLIFCSLNMICLGVVFLAFFLLVVLWASWICGMVSDINLVKFSVIIVSNISSVTFFFLPLLLSFVCYTFCSCPMVIWNSLLFFFYMCYLCFLDLEVCIVSSWGSLLSCIQSTNKPIKNVLHFCWCFWSLAFHFGSFLGFPSLFLHCPSVLACCLFPLDPLAYLL